MRAAGGRAGAAGRGAGRARGSLPPGRCPGPQARRRRPPPAGAADIGQMSSDRNEAAECPEMAPAQAGNLNDSLVLIISCVTGCLRWSQFPGPRAPGYCRAGPRGGSGNPGRCLTVCGAPAPPGGQGLG